MSYSPTETKILDHLRKVKRASTPALIEAIYGKDKPVWAAQTVVSIIRGLARKIEKNGEDFRIMQSERTPPFPYEFWLEKTAKKGAKK